MKTRILLSLAAVVGALTVGAAAQAVAGQSRDTRTAPTPQQPAPQGRDTAARTGKGVIAGVITTDEQTPQPLKRVQVTVTGTDNQVMRTAFTNDAGKFSLTGLPAGRYTLTAQKAPFLRMSYGSKRPDRPGTPITLKDAEQLTSVAMKMSRGAVMSGAITDENGLPASGVQVQAMRVQMINGERTLQPAMAAGGQASDMTDDRGVYRFYGLPAGEYVVSAQPRAINGEIKAMTDSEIRAIMNALQQQQTAAQAQTPGTNTPAPQPTPSEPPVTVGYANVYFPGVTTSASAGTVTVENGAERAGVDFALKLVRTARIEGMVVVPPGMRPQSVQLSLNAVGGSMLDLISFNRATPGPDGRFAFTAIPPGQYQIVARGTIGGGGTPAAAGAAAGAEMAVRQTFTAVRAAGPVGGGGGVEPMVIMSDGPADPNAQTFWGQTDLSVDGTTVNGVTVSMQPGMTLSGKIQFRGTRLVPDGDLSRVRLTMSPTGTGNVVRVMVGSLPTASVNPDGTFKITGISPGRYRISGIAPLPMGSGPGLSWNLASVVAKERDVLDFMLDVAPNDELQNVTVTFTDATQEIGGTLQDASGRPAPDYTIIVFADNKQFWTAPSRRIRSARPGTDGRYSVTNLPPGEYRLAAVVDVAPNEINDPAFLEQLVPASIKLIVGEGEKKTQDLRISGGL